MLDAELVLINKQVKIATSNFMIALEKTQPDVIYKVCLEILKQYSFYNAFIATADAPKIYMQQFWYTITYDLTAKAYFFTMGDQVFEVNADLLYNSLRITPKDPDHPFTLPTPEKEIISFTNQLGCTNVDFADLIWEEFKYQIASRLVSKQKQELMPLLRFTKLIVKSILSQNDQIYKRPISFHHVIKLDPTLGNLKFKNKGIKDPVFRMPILELMLNDNIKATAKYSEYLGKLKGSKPVKATSRGKGFLTKQGVEIAVKRVCVPKRRRSKTIVEEVRQSKEIAKDVDSEETDKEPPVRRPTSVVIGGEVRRESDEEGVDHSKKGSGEGYRVTLEVPDELTLKRSNEGAGVIPEVLDDLSDYSNTSSFDSEFIVEDISSDESDVTKKADESNKMDDEKAKEEHVRNQGENEQAGDAQAEVHAFEPQSEKPETTKVSSSRTLSSTEFTSQFLNDNPDVNINEVLKDPVKPKVQSMVDIPVQQVKLTE
ncbi:hypothetical protein Tco_0764444 [Tanacetum coccineum]